MTLNTSLRDVKDVKSFKTFDWNRTTSPCKTVVTHLTKAIIEHSEGNKEGYMNVKSLTLLGIFLAIKKLIKKI